jgi:PPM family protein phosphatase
MIEYEVAGVSEAGPNREGNEDAMGWLLPEDADQRRRKGLLAALADGVGGHEAGEVASSTAVEALIKEYYSPSSHSRVEPALRHAIQVANLRVHDLAHRTPSLRSMQTTLTAIVVAGTQAFVAHVGDTRAYQWRAGVLTQLTSDHSEVADLIRMRVIPPDRLREHPARNVLTRTVGHQLILRPDFLRVDVEPGDVFLLCCDGLWAEIIEDEMTVILGSGSADEISRALVDLAIERDCADNVSAQVIRVLGASEDSAGSTGSADSARAGWLAGVFQRIGRL